MEPIYVGQIMLWPLNWAPEGWALCNGQKVSINQYQALYSLLGISYGGNMQENYFCVPNLQGVVLAGTGTGPGLAVKYPIGTKVQGTITETLTAKQTAPHNHTSMWNLGPNAITANIMATAGTGTLSDVTGFTATALPAAGAASDPTVPVNLYGPAPTTPIALANDLGIVLEATFSASTQLTVMPNTGGTTPHNNMQPYLTLNYIIALYGDYPPFN